MALRGLFIGIDRFRSEHITWLSCAGRDARALHALFSDTLGGDNMLLIDEKATTAKIVAELEALQHCSPDDVVVVSFSGHGSPSHQLISYDSDPTDLAGTSISLDRLAELFSRIPAQRLVFILDCCFSGGMGAKVLTLPVQERGLDSAEAALQRLSGNGRLILTASTAAQPAWEIQRVGHGLLTWFVIEALCGAPEVVKNGKIPVLMLLQHVSERVSTEAAQFGKAQQPTVRGQMDADFAWPVFRRGALYSAAFPGRTRPVVTSEISSLEPYGFPSPLLHAWSANIPSLNQLQLDAINQFGLLEGEHLLVTAPTSSGKTMIGELAALRGAAERRRAFFLLPLRALVNDKHQYFQTTYGDFGIRTIRATGEFTDDIPDLMRGRFDICLMTYEKFSAMVLGNPHILEFAATIVVDEVQMITDPNRGVNLEFLLTLIRMRRQAGIAPQLIALSAVIGGTFAFEQWLGARLLRSEFRPVPLDEGVLCGDGSFRFFEAGREEKNIAAFIRPEYRKGSSQDYVIPLVRKLVQEHKQVIVFRETKAEARGCALYLARALGLAAANEALSGLPAADVSQASDDLRSCLQGGVAFHNADLDRDERLVIEQEFRKKESTIRVIVATTTLAMGINTPAEAIVIVGLEHPGATPYSVAEYKNMVGRAGRLGFAAHGLSFLIAPSPAEQFRYWQTYVCGKPEDLSSHFLTNSTDVRSLLLRVLASSPQANGLAADDLIEFLHGSFAAFLERQQRANWAWDRAHIEHALQDLIGHGLIARDEHQRLRLTLLGRFSGESGIEVESIIRLVEILGRLTPDALNDPTLLTLAQITVEVDTVLFPINKKSTKKEPQAWESALHNERVAYGAIGGLQYWATEHYQPTLRAKKAVACLYWISNTPMRDIEAALTQFSIIDGAAGPVRSVASRTADLLETVCRVAELKYPGLDLRERVARLLVRLHLGVPSEVLELAELFGNGLSRGDYLNLLNARLNTLASVDVASDEQLEKALGGSATRARVRFVRERLAIWRSRPTPPKPIVPLPAYRP
jgi:helicase